MLRALTLFRQPAIDEPLARAYRISAAVLRAFDRMGLAAGNCGLTFKRVTLYDQHFVACEIETVALTESLVKNLRKYRLVVMLTQTLGLPVKAVVSQNSVTFAIDLGEPRPLSRHARLSRFLRKQFGGRS